MSAAARPPVSLRALHRTGRWGAPAAALAAALYLAGAPVYGSVSGTMGEPASTHGSATLVDVNGAGVYAVLAVPVLLAALPLALPRRRAVAWASGLLLLAFTLLGAWTIGGAYVPAAALALLAAAAWE